MSSKLAKIGGFKKTLHIIASGGAAIVIVGALFKIMHWPGSGPMLIVGLLTEALIFLLYAFDIPHEEWDWSLAYPELVNIPNFKFVHKTRNLNKGGGVAFYVKNDIHFKILNDLSHFIEKEFECLTIEATINKKKVLLSNIYRSPNPLNNTSQAEHVENFINYFDTHLYNLSMKNDDLFVFLDSNINLLSINNNQNAAL